MARSDYNNKLLIVINNFNDVSHNHHLLRLIRYLSKKNIEIFLCSLKKNEFLKDDFYTIKNLQIIEKSQNNNFLKQNKIKKI